MTDDLHPELVASIQEVYGAILSPEMHMAIDAALAADRKEGKQHG